MIISIPIRKVIVRFSDGTTVETNQVVPGWARATSESRADNDIQGGGHILLSNPFLEWAMDMTNRGIIAPGEPIYLHLHTQNPSSDLDSPDPQGVLENASAI